MRRERYLVLHLAAAVRNVLLACFADLLGHVDEAAETGAEDSADGLNGEAARARRGGSGAAHGDGYGLVGYLEVLWCDVELLGFDDVC